MVPPSGTSRPADLENPSFWLAYTLRWPTIRYAVAAASAVYTLISGGSSSMAMTAAAIGVFAAAASTETNPNAASSVGTNSYDFSTATAATAYLFQVVAVNATGSSSAGTSNAVTTVPATPTMFTAHGVSTTEIDLAWIDFVMGCAGGVGPGLGCGGGRQSQQ